MQGLFSETVKLFLLSLPGLLCPAVSFFAHALVFSPCHPSLPVSVTVWSTWEEARNGALTCWTMAHSSGRTGGSRTFSGWVSFLEEESTGVPLRRRHLAAGQGHR